MSLEARYSDRQEGWYIADTTGAEFDSGLYDSREEAEADIKAITDEAAHDMPLTGQDGPTCTRPDCRNPRSCVHPIEPPADDLTAKSKASLNVPVGLSGSYRTEYLSLTDDQKRVFRHHFIAQGQPAGICLREARKPIPTVADWGQAKRAIERGDTRPPVDIARDIAASHDNANQTALDLLVADANTLHLYLVERTEDLDVDELHGVLVAAYGDDSARNLASIGHKDEGPGAWWMPTTTVTLIGTADASIDSPRVLLADRRDG
jgi:hypothetical protein